MRQKAIECGPERRNKFPYARFNLSLTEILKRNKNNYIQRLVVKSIKFIQSVKFIQYFFHCSF